MWEREESVMSSGEKRWVCVIVPKARKRRE